MALMRYHSLDFWRGLACLIVVVFHSTIYVLPTSSNPFMLATGLGWAGVPMFFVISGFCIAAASEACCRKSHGAATFFWRRFRRIYPPYWACLLGTVVLVGGGDLLCPGIFTDSIHPFFRPWWLDAWQWTGNITLTEIWRGHIIGSSPSLFLGHAWTLCYEEVFYATCGAIVAIAPRRLFTGLLVVTLVSVGLVITGHHKLFYGFPLNGLWLQFAAGLLVYWGIARGQQLLAGTVLVAALFWTPLAFDMQETFKGVGYLVAFGFALVLLAMHPWDRLLSDSRWAAPISAAGVITYSLYLVHWPICKLLANCMWLSGVRSDAATLLLTVPVCLAASVLAGWLFHIAVERRFLNSPVR
jgi:peptidoglycan/LPS O-acetylase OafA/YrhL